MLRQSAIVASFVVLSVAATSAHGQYHYPSGYRGWGGWGGAGTTAAGSISSGMGNYAAGAGAYNEQTAQARATNANTAMQWNDYMYAVNTRNANNEMAKLQRRQKRDDAANAAIYQRLHDNPSPADVHSGEALNIVLTELANPKVYTQVVQKSTQEIASGLVKSINFQFAPNMIMISLDDLSDRGVPDSLATDPAFESDRRAIRALVAKGKKEADSSNQVSIETLRSFRMAVKALQVKADAKFPVGTPRRDESDNFLKALYGLSKMLETPRVDQFLKGLDQYPSTTLGHLMTFMNSFNLRFGPAKNPEQEAAYDQLYPLLVQLRDASKGLGQPPITAQTPLPDPKQASAFFSGMQFSHFQPQPDPHATAVPAPPEPR